jgi:hypothetical protein
MHGVQRLALILFLFRFSRLFFSAVFSKMRTSLERFGATALSYTFQVLLVVVAIPRHPDIPARKLLRSHVVFGLATSRNFPRRRLILDFTSTNGAATLLLAGAGGWRANGETWFVFPFPFKPSSCHFCLHAHARFVYMHMRLHFVDNINFLIKKTIIFQKSSKIENLRPTRNKHAENAQTMADKQT